MAYIGKGLNDIATANVSVDTMTGDGSDTTLALSAGTRGIGSVNDVSVFISGIQQRPNIDYTLSAGVITFTTAPVNGQAVCAISHSDSWQDNVADSSVVTESFADLAITDAKIIGLNSSKLTGAMPAISGASLTGITETTNSASDPAIDTNGTLGDIWVNTASGEMFILTDATAGENVWTNVGGGDGDVQLWSYPGLTSGYAQGGNGRSDVKDKWSFASDGNAADAGNLTVARSSYSGYSSSTNGYAAGGGTNSSPNSDIIDKFPYASDGDSTDVGNLIIITGTASDASSSTHGYTFGGLDTASGNFICKTTFSADADSTDVGDLTFYRYGLSGHSSETHGYASGGVQTPQGYQKIIEKFTFASDADATDVGDLSTTRGDRSSGNSSLTHGYVAGSHQGGASGYTNVIDKFTFASDADATDVGDLTQTKLGMAGAGSLTFGYWAGGSTGSPSNVIEKSSYATDGNATDVGDCTVSVFSRAGTHV
jgi:hypothetical protein